MQERSGDAFTARYSISRVLLRVAGSLAFVLIGCWFLGLFGEVPSSRRLSEEMAIALGILGVSFFGLMLCFWGAALVNRREILRIDGGGIHWSRFSDQLISWAEIEALESVQVETRGYSEMVIDVSLISPESFPKTAGQWLFTKLFAYGGRGDFRISLSGMDADFGDAVDAIRRCAPKRLVDGLR